MNQTFLTGPAQRISRTKKLIEVLVKHGFRDLLIRIGLQSENLESSSIGSADQSSNAGLHARIRMTLEDLGPTYVKFGQVLSSREDLLPPGLVSELKKLQDRVTPEAIDVRYTLTNELGILVNEHFREVGETPFAAASISQVYRATLLDGSPVILKIKRRGIKKAVTGDLLIMKDFARLLTAQSDTLRKWNLVEIVEAFEKTIHAELSLLNERRNMERFGQLFRKEASVYPVATYPHLSNDDILCMAYVDGAKINDRNTLSTQGVDLEALADRGLRLYLRQVLDYGFFHADPHPGNLLVMADGRIAFIDMGSMGSMMPADQALLEEFVWHVVNKDAKRLINVIRKMAIRIRIQDENQLARDIHSLLEMLDNQALQELDIKLFFSRFSAILSDNEALLPDHAYLLVRGIVLMEGIGRELSPDMNIMERLKPLLIQRLRKKLSPENMYTQGLEMTQDLRDIMTGLSTDLPEVVRKLRDGSLQIRQENHYSRSTRRTILSAAWMLSTTLLSVGFALSAGVLYANVPLAARPSILINASIAISILFLALSVWQAWRVSKKSNQD